LALKYNSTILDLDTRWRRVVSFTSLSLNPRETAYQYSLYRRLGGPQSCFGRCGIEKNLFATVGNRNLALQLVARRYTD
jgi:hypothetical protein